MSRLQGKVALVTGAGRMRGTGHSIAVALAENGADVALHGSGRDPATGPASERAAGWRGLDEVAEEIRRHGRRSFIVVGDVRHPDEVDRLVQEVIDEYGRLDILVNNAAAPPGDDRVPVVRMSDEAWQLVLDVKLFGTFYASRAAARHMVAAGHGGRIINISSMAGKLASADMAAYNVANAGIQMLGASMARELAHAGVTVNSLCLGVIDASRIDELHLDEQYVRATVPLGRMASTQEVADVAAFLASDQAGYITGQSINVDGGVAVH
jgi:3-oxoacyl-[acyl-carrier protein] reductase/meso-butanediol dehydrogenase/(S,S)-butanediol dehydrogenase/diacetyl reductase